MHKLKTTASAVLLAFAGVAVFSLFVRRLDDQVAVVAPLAAQHKISIDTRQLNGVTCRIYSPVDGRRANRSLFAKNVSTIVFFHGGAYVKPTTNNRSYPAPVDDCYAATEYVMMHVDEFGGDRSRIALLGDSAGGNAVSVITQRLRRANKTLPKLQLLIYPWNQLVDPNLPASVFHNGAPTDMKDALRYMGHWNMTREIQAAFNRYDHLLLLNTSAERGHVVECLDIRRIPARYRGKGYYRVARRLNLMQKTLSLIESENRQLDAEHVFVREPRLAQLVRQLFTADVSPLLAEASALVGLPPALVLLVETDLHDCKDTGLMYAQRLAESGVNVTLRLYKHGYHGVFGKTNKKRFRKMDTDAATAVAMLDDLLDYLNKWL